MTNVLGDIEVAAGPWTEGELSAIRSQFASVSAGETEHPPVAYLDGAGGTQTPETVIGAMARYFRTSNANTDGAFQSSISTDELIGMGRESGAAMLGAHPEEVVFAANATTANFLLTRAFCRTLSPGDEIIVTSLDHDANISPWLLAAGDFDLKVKIAALNPEDATLDYDDLERLAGPKTKVIAFPLAANTVGTVVDVKRVVEICRAHDALAWADGVHMAVHRRLHMHEWDLDVMLTSPYKYCGPHMGLVGVRRELAQTLPAERVRPASMEPLGHRFEPGTQNHEAIAGLLAAIEYLGSLGAPLAAKSGDLAHRLDAGYARIEAQERRLAEVALTALEKMPDVKVWGISDLDRLSERTSTIAFTHAKATPRAIAERLAEENIYIGDGDHYGYQPMVALGLDGKGGVARSSFVHYNTEEEVERLVAVLRTMG